MINHWKGILVGLSLVALSSFITSASERISFQERVAAQEAIERVFYGHQIWPEGNSTPKPPFESVYPKTLLEAKVTDYLKKSAALDLYWQRPVEPEQLQVLRAEGWGPAETIDLTPSRL